MRNKFSLSFGIALIAVGVLNIFIDTNNTILFGMSISAFIFSIINILFSTNLDEKYEWIYIIPFIILLTFSCFSESLMNIEVVKNIVNSRVTGILTFISFGLSFVSEYINGRNKSSQDIIKHFSLVNENFTYSILILEKIVKYRKSLLKNKVVLDNDSEKFLEEIDNLCNENAKRASIESDLLSLKKDKFTFNDFDKAYVNNTETLKFERSKSK